MKNLLKIVLSLAVCVAAAFARADETFLFASTGGAFRFEDSGTLSGARSAARIFGGRFSKKIAFKAVAVNSAENLALELSASYLRGERGAIVLLGSDVFDATLAAKINELSARGYLVCTAKGAVEGAKLFRRAGTNPDIALSVARAELKKLSSGRVYPLLCAEAKDGAFAFFTPAERAKFLAPYKILKFERTDFFSVFANENAVEIMRFDDYGRVLFGASLLADGTLSKPDYDRKFSLCIGAAPHLVSNLRAGTLDACIFEDFRGFGYCLARAMIEKLFLSQSTAEVSGTEIFVAPLVFGKSSVSEFERLCKEWLKI